MAKGKCKDCKWWKRQTNLKNLVEDKLTENRWNKGKCYRFPHSEDKRANENCGEFEDK
ncbi:hypothetical protein LCGC14_0878220 [marine sediment metagenome]|uniref:Uncharacterized protein n=1 Tax=marine sediment metagenome TaxID=412755 RepID=A0A0F9P2Q1_9ZZZZ